MTWNHPRGIDPLVACCAALGVNVAWDARSLEDFEAFPLDELAATYDLMVIDHPHVGMAAASGCLLPFDESLARSLNGTTVGRSHESYHWQGKQWALAIDAAAQVAARRGSIDWPTTWADVVSLAKQGRVLWPLAPVHAMMSFFTRCAGKGIDIPGSRFVDHASRAGQVLDELTELASLVPAECFGMNPIAVFERMKASDEAIYVPLIYGYISYARSGAIEFANIVDGARGSALGGTGIAVSARSREAANAKRIAIALASETMQRTTYALSGGQPAHRAAWTDDAVNRDANGFYRSTIRTLDQSYLRPRFDGYIGFQQRAGEVVSQCLKRTIAPRACIEQLNHLYAEAAR
jgi:multiple sugar transport system substrate-binding protein